MTIPFIGGPYDGLTLDAFEVQRIAILTSITTKRGLRKFAIFPHPEDWPKVRSGRIRVQQSRAQYHYELVNTVIGPQHQYDLGGKRYQEALTEVL